MLNFVIRRKMIKLIYRMRIWGCTVVLLGGGIPMVTFPLGRLRRRKLLHWLKTQLLCSVLILRPEDTRMLLFHFFLLPHHFDNGLSMFRP